MSYSSEVLADSPLGYWTLGEPSGSTLTDSSGNTRNGTYGGSPTLGTTGLLPGETDTAASFNGSSDYARVSDAAWMDSANFSIDGWIKPSSASGARCILGRDGSGARGWNLYFLGGKLYVDNGAAPNVQGSTTLSAGTRYHVGMTYDGTTVRFYVDGSPDGSGAFTLTTTLANDMLIGASQAGSGGGPFNFFAGAMEKFAYSPTTLSAGRIAARYAAGVAAPATGSITLSGSAAGKASAGATGSLTLAGTATGTSGPTSSTATASLTLSGTAVALPLYLTDTTNALDGLDITFTASTSVERPPAAVPSGLVLAEKYDKAIAYPQPVMDNGRPT